MRDRIYPDWFINELAHDEDRDRAKSRELSTGSRVDFICPIHGNYNMEVFNHIRLKTGERLRGCPKCAKVERIKNCSRTKMDKRPDYPQWFIDELANEEDKRKAIDKTLKYNEKIQFICKDHGIYKQIVADHIDYKTQCKKQGCPKCGNIKKICSMVENNRKKRPAYPDWFIDELANEVDKQKAKNKELTWSDKVEFICKDHGVYLQRIDAHMDTRTFLSKQGCPICGKKKQVINRKKTEAINRVYPDWFIKELYNDGDKERAIRGEVVTDEYLDFNCPKHGVYKQYVGNHITLSKGEPDCKCPICTRQLSINEKEVYDFIESLGVKVEERNRGLIRNPETNRPMELDIFIPDKRVAIEYNGSLWHGEKYKIDRKYHFNKYILCEKQNIRLISLFDKDWLENKDKVKMFLKDLLLPKIRIVGRKTVVKQIQFTEARDFYNIYHLKNSDSVNIISYGLFYDNQLISVMSFSKPKFGKQESVEFDLSRYCVKPGYFVIGGAEKLFAAFFKENNPTSIVTYSDNDYFSGDVYPKLGFSFVKYTDLPYYWAKDNIFFSRQKCQVKKLKEKYPELYQDSLEQKEESKEDYIMHKLGYYKVYRSGNKKWLWTRDSKKVKVI